MIFSCSTQGKVTKSEEATLKLLRLPEVVSLTVNLYYSNRQVGKVNGEFLEDVEIKIICKFYKGLKNEDAIVHLEGICLKIHLKFRCVDECTRTLAVNRSRIWSLRLEPTQLVFQLRFSGSANGLEFHDRENITEDGVQYKLLTLLRTTTPEDNNKKLVCSLGGSKREHKLVVLCKFKLNNSCIRCRFFL